MRGIFKFSFCRSTGRDAPLFSVLVLLIRWQRRAAFLGSLFVIQLVETHRFCLYCILRFRKNQGLKLTHFFFAGYIFVNNRFFVFFKCCDLVFVVLQKGVNLGAFGVKIIGNFILLFQWYIY